MEKTIFLLKKLQSKANSFGHLDRLTLQKGETFSWNYTACAITYNPASTNADIYLLHEFSHAALNHQKYPSDIALLKMEREAWEYARTLANEYGVTLSEESIETSLDTYRDWLHSRSVCPSCGATGIQSATLEYSCVACHTLWRVNEARLCTLRRYTY